MVQNNLTTGVRVEVPQMVMGRMRMPMAPGLEEKDGMQEEEVH